MAVGVGAAIAVAVKATATVAGKSGGVFVGAGIGDGIDSAVAVKAAATVAGKPRCSSIETVDAATAVTALDSGEVRSDSAHATNSRNVLRTRYSANVRISNSEAVGIVL